MGSEFERAGWEPNGAKISISSSQFVDFVISKAADEAESRAHKREALARTSARWVTAVLGLLALAGLSASAYVGMRGKASPQTDSKAVVAAAVTEAMRAPGVQEDIQRAVDRAVERAVKDATAEKLAALSSRVDGIGSFQQLSMLTLQLEVKDSFSDEDRDQVLATLANVKALGGYAQRPDFQRNIKKIVDSFTSAYQVAAVDQLDNLFRGDLVSIKDVPRWMTNHLGRVLVTSSEINNKSSTRWERFRFYSDVTKQNRNPEISHMWDVLAAFVLSYERKSPEVDALVAQIGHLNEKDREIFMRALLEEGTASEREPPDMRRLAEIVGKFVTAYQTELVGFGLEVE